MSRNWKYTPLAHFIRMKKKNKSNIIKSHLRLIMQNTIKFIKTATEFDTKHFINEQQKCKSYIRQQFV